MQSISVVWAEMMLVWDYYWVKTTASVDTPALRWQDNNNGTGGEDAYLLSRVANRGAGRKFSVANWRPVTRPDVTIPLTQPMPTRHLDVALGPQMVRTTASGPVESVGW
jgi:hypothetical protein